jgi:F-type H+-transporting ATPase subunit b
MTRNPRAGRFAVTSKKIFFVSLFLVLFCSALNAHAAEKGTAANERATEIFQWINFAALIVAIVWAWNHWATPRLRRSRDRIGSAIAEATAAKAAADRQLREAETKLANLQKEVEELRALAGREGASEAERIRALAKSDAQKIFLAAKAEIEAAERAARLELKAIAAKLAVDGAETLLAKQLTPQTQESLVSAFVKSLEGRPN